MLTDLRIEEGPREMSRVGEHVKGISCQHDWRGIEGKGEIKEVCAQCGAGCTRDARGLIEAYDRLFNFGNPVKLEEERPRPQERPAKKYAVAGGR